MTVIVSHPHAAAVATGTAEALDRQNLLAAYVSGLIGSRQSGLRGLLLGALAARFPALENRMVDVPTSRVRSLGAVEFTTRQLRAFGPALCGTGLTPAEATYAAHDIATALLPWPREAGAVYAYEDAARFTFHRAARRGMHRVWDLPLPHYASLETVWRDESSRWPSAMSGSIPIEPAWKKHWKDAELALATHISVASAFTKRSLEAVGVRQPIFVLPYGFPVERFTPKRAAPSGPFTALVVGMLDLRKGTPYILQAWRRAAIPEARLRFIGGMKLAPSFMAEYAGSFEHIPWMARKSLGDEYRAADVLLFPTLGDGFGLVMQEAMCCGTAVITTPCGGGPESITDGVDGAIVPPRDIDALVDRLRAAAADRGTTFEMGRRARARAENFTWEHAGKAIVEALGSLA